MTYNLSLSSLAQNDLTAIVEYTIQQWGDNQADTYLEKIANGLSKIHDNPNIGRGKGGHER